MSSLLLKNAVLLHLSPPKIERGDVRVEAGKITRVQHHLDPQEGETVRDLAGRVLMPGLVVGHHHLYSALAPTMPAISRPPKDFHEILQLIWWRLDRALDLETVELSALSGAVEAVRCGVTTIIDHHASPSSIAGSLDAVKDGLDAVGLRGVLCYEVTGRNEGEAEEEEGLEENRQFMKANIGPRFAGMVGAHAAFTISDKGLMAVGELSEKLSAPVHIHVAEDPVDDRLCRERFGASLMARLDDAGILAEGNLLGHGIHLDKACVRRALQAGCFFAHNARSNMNNGVGYAPVSTMAERMVLGTDGIGGDMFEEFRAATFRAHDERGGVADGTMLAALVRSAEVAGKRLKVTLGKIEAGAQADLVVIDPPPAWVGTGGSALSHLLFSLSSRHVRDVMVAGEDILRDGQLVRTKETDARRRIAKAVPKLWERLPKE